MVVGENSNNNNYEVPFRGFRGRGKAIFKFLL